MTHTYSISIYAALLVGFGTIPAQAALSIQVNPRSTYLLTNNDPLAINSTAISLADSGIAPGDLIRVERFGSYDVGAQPPFFGDVLDGFSAVFRARSVSPPPERSESLPCLLIAPLPVHHFPHFIATREQITPPPMTDAGFSSATACVCRRPCVASGGGTSGVSGGGFFPSPAGVWIRHRS